MPLTRFLGMPRWKIPAALITNLDLGRSNTAHWNFIHVYGNLNLYHPESETSIAAQMLKNPPIADYVDMARSGMKPFMSVVSQSIEDASILVEVESGWRLLLIGLWRSVYLERYSKLFWYSKPIAEGDNIEVDGIALHIDSLTHSCGINGNYKYFNTTLNVTHGMP